MNSAGLCLTLENARLPEELWTAESINKLEQGFKAEFCQGKGAPHLNAVKIALRWLAL